MAGASGGRGMRTIHSLRRHGVAQHLPHARVRRWRRRAVPQGQGRRQGQRPEQGGCNHRSALGGGSGQGAGQGARGAPAAATRVDHRPPGLWGRTACARAQHPPAGRRAAPPRSQQARPLPPAARSAARAAGPPPPRCRTSWPPVILPAGDCRRVPRSAEGAGSSRCTMRTHRATAIGRSAGCQSRRGGPAPCTAGQLSMHENSAPGPLAGPVAANWRSQGGVALLGTLPQSPLRPQVSHSPWPRHRPAGQAPCRHGSCSAIAMR